jgi:hypothetical protein
VNTIENKRKMRKIHVDRDSKHTMIERPTTWKQGNRKKEAEMAFQGNKYNSSKFALLILFLANLLLEIFRDNYIVISYK